MIYYMCALAAEAKPIIEFYGLKRVNRPGRFQFFEHAGDRRRNVQESCRNAEAVLVISGTGSYNAAVAVTLLCSAYPPESRDIFINFGICGAMPESGLCIGDVCAVCGVYSDAGDRPLYPDMIIESGFRKCKIKTCAAPVSFFDLEGSYGCDNDGPELVDMESYGALFAAMSFFECHRCFVIKTVSDIVGESTVNPDGFEKYAFDKELAAAAARKGAADVVEFASKAEREIYELSPADIIPDAEDIKAAERLGEILLLSYSQKEQLRCILRRRTLEGRRSAKAIFDFIQEYCGDESQPIALSEDGARRMSRREGKHLFEAFKKYEEYYD